VLFAGNIQYVDALLVALPMAVIVMVSFLIFRKVQSKDSAGAPAEATE
jgi:hypothetical protein